MVASNGLMPALINQITFRLFEKTLVTLNFLQLLLGNAGAIDEFIHNVSSVVNARHKKKEMVNVFPMSLKAVCACAI